MRIFIVTPAGRRSRSGNRNTAVRWAALLREAGHVVSVATDWNAKPADVLIALHARRSHASIVSYRASHPRGPLVLALTGTDLYRDIELDANARASMTMADRMIVLQEDGLSRLTRTERTKTRVIYQSAVPLARTDPVKRFFELVVIGHLRQEKDPFRAALDCAYLEASSRIRVLHLGAALSDDFAREARDLMQSESRYHWLGELPHWKVRRYLSRARALVITSRMEGGANVVSEALAADLPVLASRVSGNIGMLGSDYGGYYPVEDECALAGLMGRFESEAGFRQQLQRQCAARKPLVSAAHEKSSLVALVAEAVHSARISS